MKFNRTRLEHGACAANCLLLGLIFLAVLLNHVPETSAANELSTITGNSSTHINILLLLPTNDTYKFSQAKVTASLRLAIADLKHTAFGSRFEIDLISDSCDCTGIKAPVNAMENIFGKRNHTKKFQAVFGPMCD
jgi:hypothetical protein